MDKLKEKFALLSEAEARAIKLGDQVSKSHLRTEAEVYQFRVIAGFHRALWQQCHLFLVDACKG